MLKETLNALSLYGYTILSYSGDKKWYNIFDLGTSTGCIVEENEHGDVYIQFHFSTFTLTVEGNKIGASHVIGDTTVFHHAMRVIVEARELFTNH